MTETLCEHDFRAILARYQLGDFVAAEPFGAGAVQVNVRLTATSGSYALKWYRNRSLERVAVEVHMLRHLQRRGFPGPIPVRDAEGGYVGEYRGRPYLLSTIVPGKHSENPSVAQLKQVAGCMGNLHRMSRGYRPPSSGRGEPDPRGFVWKAAQSKAEKAGWNEQARGKVKRIRCELDSLRFPNSLPKGICHADYHHSNVLFKDGRLSGLVDFDDARHARVVFDIANFLDYWVWPWGQGIDFRRARDLLGEYQKRRAMNEAEKRHLFDAWKWQILLDATHFFSRGSAEDCRERKKIAYLEGLGRERIERSLFS